MTNGELIEELQKYPLNYTIMIPGSGDEEDLLYEPTKLRAKKSQWVEENFLIIE